MDTNLDFNLLHRLRMGDKKAFEILYWKYNAKIFNFVNHILFDKSLAEDVTQNCFIKIWEKRAEIDPDKSFPAYIMVISRNMAYKEILNKVSKISLEDVEYTLSESISTITEDEINYRFTESFIESLIEKLPTSRKQIFKMSRYQGLTNKEIAKELNISEKTVETQVYRSIRFLKENIVAEIPLLTLLIF